MSATFSVKQLPKTDSSLTRLPNFHKYYISCSGRITHKTPITVTTDAWLNVLKSIRPCESYKLGLFSDYGPSAHNTKMPNLNVHGSKVDSDLDKSRVLLGFMEKYGEMVIKIGDTESMLKEYTNSTRVHGLKGFVKYICNFSCNDDFRSIPTSDRTSLCKGPGDTMGIILMPYFPLGSIAKYPWGKTNIVQLRSCLKHALLSIIVLFHKMNMIHGDFHPGNVLLKPTKQSDITYSIPEVGEFNVKANGMRTWIMDYEKTDYANYSSKFTTIISFNNFYYDIQKFFMLLYNTIKTLDPRTIMPIASFVSNRGITSSYLTKKDIDTIFVMIDNIDILE
jgi:hypothetical protein